MPRGRPKVSASIFYEFAGGQTIGCQIDQDLADKLNKFMASEGIVNRSEGLRLLLTMALASDLTAAIYDARTRRAFTEVVLWAKQRLFEWIKESERILEESIRMEQEHFARRSYEVKSENTIGCDQNPNSGS